GRLVPACSRLLLDVLRHGRRRVARAVRATATVRGGAGTETRQDGDSTCENDFPHVRNSFHRDPSSGAVFAVAATLADPMGAPSAAPARGRLATPLAPLALTGAVAAVTFLLAYDGGSFALTSRGTLSIAVWWVVLLAVVSGLWPLRALDRTTLIVGGLLA